MSARSSKRRARGRACSSGTQPRRSGHNLSASRTGLSNGYSQRDDYNHVRNCAGEWNERVVQPFPD